MVIQVLHVHVIIRRIARDVNQVIALIHNVDVIMLYVMYTVLEVKTHIYVRVVMELLVLVRNVMVIIFLLVVHVRAV